MDSRGIINTYRAGGATTVAYKSASTKKESETPDIPKNPLDKVLSDFNSSWEYCASSWHSRWKDNHDLYNNIRVKRGYDGITDTFVPMAFGVVETLTSALFGSKPKFTYLAPEEKDGQKTDILNSLLDYYWDKDQWSIKVINTGRAMFKIGTGVDYFYWEGDHPCMLNIPMRDFFFDVTASSLETMEFAGRRYLTTLDELKEFEIVDPETGELKKKYSNLDKYREGTTGENTDKQEKDMWYGSTVTDAKNKQVEVIEYWTDDRVISIMNRQVVIEDSENYFKAKARANGVEDPEGIIPFAAARDYVDESLFLAKGEIDFISDQQELLNDITNQNIDSVTYTLNQMYTLDPKYAHMISEIENLPGAVYPVEANALQPIQQRPIPPDAFNERLNIKNEIRETTASNEVVKGVGQEGGKATATEINAQVAGAGQRINLKVTQIENEYFHRMARIIFQMIRLYVTEPMMVRVMGKDGANWEMFDPSEFAEGEYEPRVQLDIYAENKRREEAMEAKELLQMFMGDPDINQRDLKKKVLKKAFNMDDDEAEMLLARPMQDPMTAEQFIDPMSDPMTGIDPAMMQMPPEQLDMPPEAATMPTPEELAAMDELLNGVDPASL